VGVDVERTAGKPPPRPPPPTFPQPTLQPQSQRRDTGQYRPQAGANFRPPNALNTNITCYKCKGFGHTRKFCPSLSQNFNNQGQRNERRVNACSKQVARPKPTCDESIAVSKDQDASVTMSSLECMIVEHLSSNAVECNSVNQGDNVDKQSYVNDYDAYRDFVSLQYVNVSIDEMNTDCRPNSNVRALEDSGTELCVINSSLVESLALPKLGSVRLRGIVGAPVSADLVKLHISLVDSTNGNVMSSSIPVVCAVCTDLNEDMILTSAVVSQLQSLRKFDIAQVDSDFKCDDTDNVNVVDDINNEHVVRADAVHTDVTEQIESETKDTNQVSEVSEVIYDRNKSVSDVDQFRKEQTNDESLKPCWIMASKGKGGFTVEKELLYHTEHIACVGRKVTQLCLPASRRKTVLELAHSTIGCHQAYKRTRDRIRLSFYWPLLSSECKKFCSQCAICQKTARVTVWDRTPIMAVPRAQYAFQQFYADCGGPLFPIKILLRIITLLYCVIQLRHFHLRIPYAV